MRPKSSPSRKKPRKVTAESLERAALHYLERYASSAVNLRRVLMRRVLRAAEAHGTEPADGAGLVDALVARFRQGGLLDDATYARLRAESLHRQGASRRMTQAKLAAKGVDGEDIGTALAALEDIAPAPDLAAACHFARRRRLGPWRRTGRLENRERDLAALGRQGFSYDIARAVIDAPDRDALEAEARGDTIGGP